MFGHSYTRHEFGEVAGVLALGMAATPAGAAAQTSMPQSKSAPRLPLKFPDGFYWGVATSAYQIEGAVKADGRGVSIWDTYAHTPGKIKNGDTGDVADDHYHRYAADVTLMQSVGVKAYRFSIAWPRIFPDGTGPPNAKGLAFYDRLVDALLAAGIEPFPTLYHWDLPQTLQDKYGGWQSRETAKAFADYTGYVAAKLSDRVKHFFTMNEFYSFVDMGYQGIEMPVGGKNIRINLAPGLQVGPAIYEVRHNAVLGQGLAVQAIRAMGKPGTKCGPADNINSVVPVVDTVENIAAAQRATRELNAAYLTVMLEGAYTDAYLKMAGKDAPKISDGDLKIIGTPVDFVGINVYRPTAYVLPSDEAPGFKEIPFNASHPHMLSSWHLIGPEVMYWAPRQVQSLWGSKEIYITESGCAASDVLSTDGHVYDSDRIMYMRNNLVWLQRAASEDIPIRGCFQWSFMDNFEWGDGYGNRFGLVYVDFPTQKRTPKLSASYFKTAATANAVV
jgi:beta-glucosidase